MLLELRVVDFALARDVAISLGPSLTMLTGETGAGKSLIAGALGLLAGGKAPKDLVRRGCEEAMVEGVFELDPEGPAAQALARHGVRPGADGILVLRREIRREGRSRVLVNGSVSSLAILETIGPLMVSVQSQDQQRELADPGFARGYLDALLGLETLRSEVAAAHAEHRDLRVELASRREDERLAREQLDLWQYQYEELAAAGLDPDEEEELAERLSTARHAAALQEGAAAALDALSEGEWSARDRIGAVLKALNSLRDKSARLAEVVDGLESAAEAMADSAAALTRFLDGMELDPRERDELEERQALYSELQRKYRRDVRELIEWRDRLGERLARQQNAARDLAELEARVEKARERLERAAVSLHEARARGAPDAARRALELVRTLALPEVELEFRVSVDPDETGPIAVAGKRCAVGPQGADTVRLLVRTNPGESAGEVARIASGGERSRIHLGLTALARAERSANGLDPGVLLLDEVDAGLGMDTAPPVARLLQRLARDTQVVCITHLPTMAVHGRQHLKVEKAVRDGRTTLQIRALGDEERVQEVARLLGGEGFAERDTDAQESYARQLLGTGRREAAEAS